MMHMNNNTEINKNNCDIIGNNNTITGNNNTITGDNNTVIGNNNEITGNNNMIIGDNNDATGNNNRADGNNNDLGNSQTQNFYNSSNVINIPNITPPKFNFSNANITYSIIGNNNFKKYIGIKKKKKKKKKKEELKVPTLKVEKIKDENSELICIVCFENKINTIILDCKHSCLCSDCAKKILNLKKENKPAACPKCRTKIIKGIDNLYIG